MCIYHEAVRLPGVRPAEALALTVLPAFERKHPFLPWFLHTRQSNAWQVRVLQQLANEAVGGTLLEELLAMPEEQGYGPKALELIRGRLGQGSIVGSSRVALDVEGVPTTIYHQAMMVDGLNREIVLAIGALQGYKARATCLSWYDENPGSSSEWQVQVLDNVARAAVGGVCDELDALAPSDDCGVKAVEIICARTGLNKGEKPGPKKPCCGG